MYKRKGKEEGRDRIRFNTKQLQIMKPKTTIKLRINIICNDKFDSSLFFRFPSLPFLRFSLRSRFMAAK